MSFDELITLAGEGGNLISYLIVFILYKQDKFEKRFGDHEDTDTNRFLSIENNIKFLQQHGMKK